MYTDANSVVYGECVKIILRAGRNSGGNVRNKLSFEFILND